MDQRTPDADRFEPDEDGEDGTIRLHKFLAHGGAGSRRECESFVAQGRVTVNGRVVKKMGVKVDPDRDDVRLDGERVRVEDRVYYLVNKPPRMVCTNADERGRPRVVDLLPRERRRIYTVGRLDADSTGLLLLTNDGDIANVICHPRYRIEKVYRVSVRGRVDADHLRKLAEGVWLAEGKASPARVSPVRYDPQRDLTWIEVTLFEGRNREVRRTFAAVGLKVKHLERVRLGPLALGDLPRGAWRRLDVRELAFVHEAELLYRANKTAWDAELPARPRPAHRPALHRGGQARHGTPRGGAGRGVGGGRGGAAGRGRGGRGDGHGRRGAGGRRPH